MQETPAALAAFERGSVQMIPLADLRPWETNYRHHPAEQLDRIRESLRRNGQRKAVVVQASTMRIIAGHGVAEAMRLEGYAEARCDVWDCSDEQAAAYLVDDNELSRHAVDDEAVLASLLLELRDTQYAPVSFNEAEIEELLAESMTPGPFPDAAEPEEPPVDPVTKPGDVWLCGKHRVVCGDAIEPEDWERTGAQRDGCVAFWSPPYALGKSIALRGRTQRARAGSAYVGSDDASGQWRALIDAMTSNALNTAECAVVNVQPLAGNKRDLVRWLAEWAGRLCDVVTWDKGHAAPPMAQGVLASRYEWLVVLGDEQSTRAIPLSSWRGTMQSVYSGPPQRDNEFADIHGATFPVHLPRYVLGELCDESRSVIDCCLGTGTTLIAAEQLGRVCYGIEIEPRYVDVAVRRWMKTTGNVATLEATGEAFPVSE